jgi:hypothetical protein
VGRQREHDAARLGGRESDPGELVDRRRRQLAAKLRAQQLEPVADGAVVATGPR